MLRQWRGAAPSVNSLHATQESPAWRTAEAPSEASIHRGVARGAEFVARRALADRVAEILGTSFTATTLSSHREREEPL